MGLPGLAPADGEHDVNDEHDRQREADPTDNSGGDTNDTRPHTAGITTQ
jgi:hypothetical protein